MANLEEMTDDALVELCISHGNADQRPFGELFRRHWWKVFQICRRFVRDHDDASDLAQETFFRAFRALEGYSGGHPAMFRAWLARIAANVGKNELRRRSRRPQLADQSPAPTSVMTDSSQAETLVRRQQAATLAEALSRLPADHRTVLELAEYQQLPYSEIAAALGLSLSAVKMRAMRARAALARVYREVESAGGHGE